MRWKLEHAQNEFSALMKAAEDDGPQFITVEGHKRAVLISVEEYRRLKGRTAAGTLFEFMQASPWADTELEPARDRELPRPVSL